MPSFDLFQINDDTACPFSGQKKIIPCWHMLCRIDMLLLYLSETSVLVSDRGWPTLDQNSGIWLHHHQNTYPSVWRYPTPYPLWHNRKMSFTWNLPSHFSNRHASCCYKLFKQWLRTSIFAAFAENSLWPWTWYVAIVRVISQVTGNIRCCKEPKLSSRFDSLPIHLCFDILSTTQWQSSHVGRKEQICFCFFIWEQHPVSGIFKGAIGQLTWKKLASFLCSHMWDDLGLASFVCKKRLSWRQLWTGMSTIW